MHSTHTVLLVVVRALPRDVIPYSVLPHSLPYMWLKESLLYRILRSIYLWFYTGVGVWYSYCSNHPPLLWEGLVVPFTIYIFIYTCSFFFLFVCSFFSISFLSFALYLSHVMLHLMEFLRPNLSLIHFGCQLLASQLPQQWVGCFLKKKNFTNISVVCIKWLAECCIIHITKLARYYFSCVP